MPIRGYDTWEAYLAERWDGLSRSEAHRQIQGAKVVDTLTRDSGESVLPANVTQAVELARI